MILLDTHALLWWTAGDQKLSARAAKAIARAKQVMVSPVSFWEIGVLAQRGRIRLLPDVFEWIDLVLSQPEIDVATPTPVIGASAALLGGQFPADPSDRWLYATAKDLAIPFVSKDEKIRRFAADTRDVKVIW